MVPPRPILRSRRRSADGGARIRGPCSGSVWATPQQVAGAGEGVERVMAGRAAGVAAEVPAGTGWTIGGRATEYAGDNDGDGADGSDTTSDSSDSSSGDSQRRRQRQPAAAATAAGAGADDRFTSGGRRCGQRRQRRRRTSV